MNHEHNTVQLRAVLREDLDQLFMLSLDPESNDMAKVFPRSRSEFDALWERTFADQHSVARAILLNGELVGKISSFQYDGQTEVGYWIDREHWGKGIATKALDAFLELVETRPLRARVATTNLGSARVLERCGFVKVSQHESPEDDRYAACIEAVYVLA